MCSDLLCGGGQARDVDEGERRLERGSRARDCDEERSPARTHSGPSRDDGADKRRSSQHSRDAHVPANMSRPGRHGSEVIFGAHHTRWIRSQQLGSCQDGTGLVCMSDAARCPTVRHGGRLGRLKGKRSRLGEGAGVACSGA